MGKSGTSTTNIAGPGAQAGILAGNASGNTVNFNNYYGTRPLTSPEDAAANLAKTVRTQWDQEARWQAVHGDDVLPVRFDLAMSDLHGEPRKIHGTEDGPTSEPLALSWQLDEIAAVYRSIPSGRLVVLGGAGSGKTILAMRFVLSRLENPGAVERVPVIFSLGSWNPETIALRDWMCRRMVLDYPALEAPAAGGGSLADALIDGEHILPVLDGFDEIDPSLRVNALKALNYYADPLVLTSRPDAYAKAVKAEDSSVLAGAACVQLQALAIEDIDAYLTSADPEEGGEGAAWRPVLEQLRARPRTPGAAIVAEALASPLMLTLARTVYRGSRQSGPDVLLKFPTSAAVQEHLLAEFIPSVYGRPTAERGPSTPSVARTARNWNAKNAQRWLGYLADHLAELGTQDIEWWQIGGTMTLRARMLVVGAAVGLVTGLVFMLTFGIEFPLEAGSVVQGLEAAVPRAIEVGLGLGLTFGVMHGYATARLTAGGPVFKPSHMRPKLDDGFIEIGKRMREQFWPSLLPRVRGGFLGGLLFGSLWASAVGLLALLEGTPWRLTVLDSASLLILAVGIGVGVGLVAAIGAALETVIEPKESVDPVYLLNTSRQTALTQLLAVALVIGVGVGLVYGFAVGPAGIGPAMATGIAVGFGMFTMTAWGRWVLLARIWLPLKGKVPGAMFDFLQDAHRRGVLRQSGAVYQFRHELIRARLAEAPRPAAESITAD